MGWGLGSFALLVGCVGAPPPAPGADTGSETGEVSTSTSALTSAVTTELPPGDTTAPPLMTTGPDDDTSEGLPGTPELVISDGPVFDFGDVGLGEAAQGLLEVINVGGGVATGMTGTASSAPFSFAGGAYPGAGGDCGDSLAPGSGCLVVVELAPSYFGPFQGQLRVEHDAGEASAELVGRGVGASTNLLVNPGGERLGSPPPGWSDSGPGNWVAEPPTSVMPYEGVSIISAADGLSGPAYVLQQIVSLEDDNGTWSPLIDSGELQMSFTAWARSRIGDDLYRIRLRYRDALAVTLGEYLTPWDSIPEWTEITLSETLPTGARSVVVELMCMKMQGTLCSGYFDALDLHVEYP